MFNAFDDTVDNPNNIVTFIVESLTFSVIGIIGGSLIDALFVKLSKKYRTKSYKLLLVLGQIFLSIIMMYILWKITKNTKFAEYWQNTIPGLAFPAFYFGIQSNIYSTIQSLYL